MKDRPKLTLVSDNPNLKTYYVPLTRIQVEIYPVKASSPEEAIWKANQGNIGDIVKKVSLEERLTNDVYLNSNIDTNTLFSRQIDDFDLDIKDFDYPIPCS
jgi:hypothetical protein|tara:strand:+ start:479 stop:781 length:303 start_codon:yes stop_codon:yes gene_type:complete